MATMTTNSSNQFLLSTTSTTQNYNKTLKTAGTFVDKDIVVDITAQDGSITPSVTNISNASASIAASGFTESSTATNYAVTLTTGNGSAKAKNTVNQAGWIATGSTSGATTIGVTKNKTNLYIPAGAVKATISSNTAGSASMTATNMTTVASSDYYVTLSTTAGSVKGTASVKTEGYVKDETATTTATNVTVNGNGNKLYIQKAGVNTAVVADGILNYFTTGTSADKNITLTPKYSTSQPGYLPTTSTTNNGGVEYYKIKPGTISSGSSAQSGTNWVTNTTTVPAEGYLYIAEGWYPPTQISLASMIPDDANYTNAGTGQMLKNYEAYDTNGKKLIGTIVTLSPSSDYYTTTNSGFGALGAGYLSKTYYIKAGSCTVAGGGLSVTTNYSATPTVSLATGSSTNMGNITIGAQDTTNYPYYFKVNASSGALSGTTKVTRAAITDAHTAGWIAAKSATTAIASTTASPTVTVNAGSGSTYVSLKKAAMTVAGTNTVTPTATVSNLSNIELVTTNVSGVSVRATGGGTASVTATATTSTAGYAPASTQLGSATLAAASKTTTNDKYVAGVTLGTPTSGNYTFKITDPITALNSTYWTVTVDTSGNVWVS